jgi:cysteine desulfurase
MNKKTEIYLDYAATTPVDPRVKAAMEPYFEAYFGNPSSLYASGQRAKKALDESRRSIAQIINCEPSEIIFVGSGTESINLGLLGLVKAIAAANVSKESSQNKSDSEAISGPNKGHIITTQIEHHAVLNTCKHLEAQGYDVTYLSVPASGVVDVASVTAAIRPDTLLVSVMYANNEIGTIQPVEEIAALCRTHKIYFHTDACQAAGALSLDTQKLGVDLMTINSSKVYGPKGVGLLYVRQGTPMQPIIYGGGQELGLRSGTENVPGIVGFAKALTLVQANKTAENKRLTGLRDYFAEALLSQLPDAIINGSMKDRLPNNLSITFPGVDGESFVLAMDALGVACATGSACDATNTEPSHVLLAIRLTPEAASSTIRFSMGAQTSKTDLEYVIKTTVTTVKQLRQLNDLGKSW